VLELLATGRCNKVIARDLGISVGTVKTHLKGVMTKLGATARTHAVVLATQRGLVDQRFTSHEFENTAMALPLKIPQSASMMAAVRTVISAAAAGG
jgi:predicted transcriptional regulator